MVTVLTVGLLTDSRGLGGGLEAVLGVRGGAVVANDSRGVSRRQFLHGVAAAGAHRLGVRFQPGWTIEALHLDGGRIEAASARDMTGRTATISADWFLCAMPAERAVTLLSQEVPPASPVITSSTPCCPRSSP